MAFQWPSQAGMYARTSPSQPSSSLASSSCSLPHYLFSPASALDPYLPLHLSCRAPGLANVSANVPVTHLMPTNAALDAMFLLHSRLLPNESSFSDLFKGVPREAALGGTTWSPGPTVKAPQAVVSRLMSYHTIPHGARSTSALLLANGTSLPTNLPRAGNLTVRVAGDTGLTFLGNSSNATVLCRHPSWQQRYPCDRCRPAASPRERIPCVRAAAAWQATATSWATPRDPLPPPMSQRPRPLPSTTQRRPPAPKMQRPAQCRQQ